MSSFARSLTSLRLRSLLSSTRSMPVHRSIMHYSTVLRAQSPSSSPSARHSALMANTAPSGSSLLPRSSLLLQAGRVPVRSLYIQTQDTPNPRSLKFIPSDNRPVMPAGQSADFPNFKAAQLSPLAKKLFQIEGVTGCFFTQDFIAVSIDEDSDWQFMKPEVFACIMDFFVSGDPIMTDMSAVDMSTMITDDDSEVVAMIKELIETRIRPAVQEDGGDLLFREFTEEGIVKVQLQGSCVGCPSSSVTLKMGVENMLMHYIEEVKGVENIEEEEDDELMNGVGNPGSEGEGEGDGANASVTEGMDADELRKFEEGLSRVRD